MTSNRQISAVVDTNLFVSGLIVESGNPYELLQAVRDGAFLLVTSDELVEELTDVLHRPRFETRFGIVSDFRVARLLSMVAAQARFVAPKGSLLLTSRDPKDDALLAAAFAGEADYLVTGDNDLLTLRDEPGIGNLKIVTAREFLAVMQE